MTHLLLTTRLVGFVCHTNNVPFASTYTLYRRLNKLRNVGFIERFRLLQTGEFAYHLTTQGKQFIQHYDGECSIPKKSTKATSITLQAHEFDVSRFWIKFFSDSSKLNIPTLKFLRDGSFVYHSRYGKLIPDGTALLRIQKRAKVFFLELDRSTQTSGLCGNEQAVIRQKLIRYRQLHKTYKIHSDLASYRPNLMRVVFVCQTQERAINLKHIAEQMDLGKLVCFTVKDRFLDIVNISSAEGWNYHPANIFAASLFYYPGRSPPHPLL